MLEQKVAGLVSATRKLGKLLRAMDTENGENDAEESEGGATVPVKAAKKKAVTEAQLPSGALDTVPESPGPGSDKRGLPWPLNMGEEKVSPTTHEKYKELAQDEPASGYVPDIMYSGSEKNKRHRVADKGVYHNYQQWKAKCKAEGATYFDGDKDICEALTKDFREGGKSVGSWDGETGTLEKPRTASLKTIAGAQAATMAKLERQGWSFSNWIGDEDEYGDRIAVMIKKPNRYETRTIEVNQDGSTNQ
jgi:hypothetical protein